MKKSVKNNPSLLWPSQRRIGTAYFRCGAVVDIREYVHNKSDEFFPHKIKLEGYHAGDSYWSYDNAGNHGQGTGPSEEYPFDIMKIVYP